MGLTNRCESECSVPSHQTLPSWHEKETYVSHLHICTIGGFCTKTAENSLQMLCGVKALLVSQVCDLILPFSERKSILVLAVYDSALDRM